MTKLTAGINSEHSYFKTIFNEHFAKELNKSAFSYAGRSSDTNSDGIILMLETGCNNLFGLGLIAFFVTFNEGDGLTEQNAVAFLYCLYKLIAAVLFSPEFLQ